MGTGDGNQEQALGWDLSGMALGWGSVALGWALGAGTGMGWDGEHWERALGWALGQGGMALGTGTGVGTGPGLDTRNGH